MNLFWKMALLNLRRNRRRSLATGSAIAAGFLGLSILGSYIYGLQMGMQANMVYLNLQGHIQIHKKDSFARFSITPKKYLLTPELDAQIDEALKPLARDIDFQGKFLTGSGLVISGTHSQPFLATGFDRETLRLAHDSPFVHQWGRMILSQQGVSGDFGTAPDALSLTPRLAEILALPEGQAGIGQPLQLATTTFERDLNAAGAVLGGYHSTGIELAEDTSVRMSLPLLQNLLATDGYQWRSLFLHQGVDVHAFQKTLAARFAAMGLPLETWRFDQEGLGDFYLGSINFLVVMGFFFVVLICTMVALSIVNSLTLGILERTKELGTLKALGFSRAQIVGLFVREAVWLTAISMIFGFALSLVVSVLVNTFDIRFHPPNIEGEIRLMLQPNARLDILFCTCLLVIAAATAALVSNKKLKASAVKLLSDAGV